MATGKQTEIATVHDFLSIKIQKGPVIEKVQEILRQNKGNETCFAPCFIAFGPYHHGKQELKRGEEVKIQLMQKWCNAHKASCEKDYCNVKAVASEAQKCYSEDSTKEFKPDDFANMMFLDGCAFPQFISCVVNSETDNWNDLDIKTHEMALIIRDMFLLENKLPLVLLKELKSKKEVENMFTKFIKITRSVPKDPKPSWSAKIADFFSKYRCKGNVKDQKSSQNEEVLHLLDSIWKFYVNESDYDNVERPETSNDADNVERPETSNDADNVERSETSNDWYTFRSAKDLKAAGINLSPSETHRFTDIKYNPLPLFPRSFLCLPPIIVDDFTKSFLLNLASYEMSSNGPTKYAVSSYIIFMDSLIDHPEDVAELRRSSVILNCLGSDQMVASLFNDIANGLAEDTEALGVVKKEIERHYRSTVKRWINEWYYTHFRNPWTFLVFIGAVLGLGMTFAQTYIAIRNFINK